jgi:predicted nucleic acid-binding protein
VKRFVIDASVAVKWLPLFGDEPLASHARWYLDRRNAGEISVVVPELFWAEVSNVLWKTARRGTCDPEEASVALSTLQEQELTAVPSLVLVNSALRIAMEHGRSLYDCLYVALAVRSNAQLVTADEKLVNALAGHFPVKWLGAI